MWNKNDSNGYMNQCTAPFVPLSAPGKKAHPASLKNYQVSLCRCFSPSLWKKCDK